MLDSMLHASSHSSSFQQLPTQTPYHTRRPNQASNARKPPSEAHGGRWLKKALSKTWEAIKTSLAEISLVQDVSEVKKKQNFYPLLSLFK